MTGHSRSLKVFVSIALVVMTCAGLASCGGSSGGSRPDVGSGGDEMIIMPRPPSQGAANLVVGSPSVNDSSPETGGAFTLSATVSNQGDGESAATTLRHYLSTDATITTSDTAVGTVAVGTLAAAGTSSESISLTAPSTAGTYYYGACVDAVTGESDTTNNCSASVQVDVSAQPTSPDLSVGSPSVSDSSPETGGAFMLSATVSNQGGGESAATTLRYYLSTDATITTSDTAVGTVAVGTLAAAGTSSESISLTAPSTAGTYYYGACVDAVAEEFDTTNNCSTAIEVNVLESDSESGGQPDLMVASPRVSDDGPAVGTTFTLSVTVNNAGDGASPSAMMRYYRSTDSTITTSDTPAGTDEVGELGASGSGSKSVELTAPSTPGAYYYGACVDAVTKESDTTNNCSPSVEVNVPKSEPQSEGDPDLSIPAVSAATSPGGTYTGDAFTVSATVRNDGDGDSAATTLRYYRSADGTITTSDTEVGTDSVGALSAGATSSESIGLAAPSSAGTYYYGACVDAVAGESDTTNNCSGSVSVGVSEPQTPSRGSPDLIIGASAFGVNLYGLIGFSVNVRNVGDSASAATTLRYYRSTDATITTSDTEEAADGVEGLAPRESVGFNKSLYAPSLAGTYYYGFCLDPVAGESDTTNNCKGYWTVTVPPPPPPPPVNPDLEVQSPSVTDHGLETGDSFTLSATVRNDGDGSAATTTLRYYRSTDATVTTTDTEVGTDSVGALSAGATSSESIGLAAPSSAGTYYYGACVDAVAGESDTTDNCSGSVSVGVSEPQTPSRGSPDLIIGASAFGVNLYGLIGFSVNVRNVGDSASAATTLRYYRSTDATITTSDTEEAADGVEGLAPRETVGFNKKSVRAVVGRNVLLRLLPGPGCRGIGHDEQLQGLLDGHGAAPAVGQPRTSPRSRRWSNLGRGCGYGTRTWPRKRLVRGRTAGRVGGGIAAPRPSQSRACAIDALGSSPDRFAQETLP